MDESEDIFGEDVKDSSYLQIVSSDEEDLCVPKTPEKLPERNNLRSNPSSNKALSYDERLNKQFRLDKTLETDVSAEAQNIIDEINKIFDKSQENESKEEDKSLLEKGKRIIDRLKTKFVTKGQTPREQNSSDSEFANLDLKSNTKRRRIRYLNETNFNYGSSLDNLFSTSGSGSETSDENYDPREIYEKKAKKGRKLKRKGNSNVSSQLNSKKRSGFEGKRRVLDKNKKFDKFGFENFLPQEEPSQNFEDFENSPSDLFCLKFAVIDENGKVVNDPRLDKVFIKKSETLGNIAKKIGEMYNLSSKLFEKVKVIIDGDSQAHGLEIGIQAILHLYIGNPELCVENQMQIDIKFPPKEEMKHNKIQLSSRNRNKKKLKDKKSGSSPAIRTFNNNEIVEID